MGKDVRLYLFGLNVEKEGNYWCVLCANKQRFLLGLMLDHSKCSGDFRAICSFLIQGIGNQELGTRVPILTQTHREKVWLGPRLGIIVTELRYVRFDLMLFK